MEKKWKGTGTKRSYTDIREEMMYIPILKTIQTLLEDPEVAKQVHTLSIIVVQPDIIY